MKTANPYLNFPGNTLEAFEFYRTVFGGEFVSVVRFRDLGESGMGATGDQLDRIAHVSLPLGERNLLMGNDVLEGWKTLTAGNNVYVSLDAESGEEARRIFGALSEGGGVEMPLQRTPWAELYGVCVDRFGIQWMMTYAGDATLPG